MILTTSAIDAGGVELINDVQLAAWLLVLGITMLALSLTAPGIALLLILVCQGRLFDVHG